MTAFEFCLYAAAALFVLWARAGAPLPADTPAAEPIAPIAAPEVKPAAPVPAQSAAIAPPVAVSVVKVETPAFAKMSSEELRRECQRLGVAWRNAHGKGKHLLKPEMVKALS